MDFLIILLPYLMILVFGEILFDLFPGCKRLGGAPLNFAYHLKKLGLDVRFISRVSKDSNGMEILDFLSKNNFDINDIQIDSASKTGTVNVIKADDGGHSFEIVKNAAYDNLEYSDKIRNLINENPDLVYFGTLIQRTAKGSETVEKILSKLRGKSRLFCDLNLRPGCYSPETVKRSLYYSDLLKINNDELDILYKQISENTEAEPSAILTEYSISDLIITRGESGSLWIRGEETEKNSNVEKISVADTVGAGDAFAAVAAAGYLQKIPVKKILELGSGFAAHICTVQGALPETDFYYDYLKKEMRIKNEK